MLGGGISWGEARLNTINLAFQPGGTPNLNYQQP